MPILENTGSVTQHIREISGVKVPVLPGKQVTTYRQIPMITGSWSEIDPLPIWNPLTANTNIIGVDAQTIEHPLDPSTVAFAVMSIESGITVNIFLQETSNIPPIVLDGSETSPVQKIEIDEKTSQLQIVFTGGGNVNIIEFLQEVK